MKVKTRRDDAESPLKTNRLKYQQVKDFVMQQIAEGHLKPGDALPPERVLAKKLGRGVQTVRHALGELSQDNIVQRVQGKGTFVNEAGPTNKDSTNHKKKKLDAFALVLPELGGSLYPSLSKGFIESSGASHHQVLVCDTQSSIHAQGDMILQLIQKNIAGAAIVPTVSLMPGYQFDALRSHGIPVVFCHRRPEGFRAPLVTWSWEDVGRRAAQAIVQAGHRRVVFVAAGRYEVTTAYLEGFREILSQHGLELPDHRAIYNEKAATPPAEDDVHRQLMEMLTAPDRPTAFFCSDAIEAERVFLEAVRLGLKVPDDLSIVGFGCVHREGVLSRRLSAVTIDETAMGRRAAQLLGQMQSGQSPLDGQQTILVPLGFSQGQTLGAVTAAMRPVHGENGAANSEGNGAT